MGSLASEYVQLWDIVKNALKQSVDILWKASGRPGGIRVAFLLVLSQYDVEQSHFS
jgi:hypothetical protein